MMSGTQHPPRVARARRKLQELPLRSRSYPNRASRANGVLGMSSNPANRGLASPLVVRPAHVSGGRMISRDLSVVSPPPAARGEERGGGVGTLRAGVAGSVSLSAPRGARERLEEELRCTIR